jgi:phage tail sheath protein FI
MYQHPGVYIEHVPSNQLSIEQASTAVAAFIGFIPRGVRITDDKTKSAPTFITNVTQYAQAFGPLGGGSGGIRDENSTADEFGHAINLYFANGGTKAYVVPVANTDGSKAKSAVLDTPDVKIEFEATSGGTWANDLIVRVDKVDGEYTITLGTKVRTLKADGTMEDKEEVVVGSNGESGASKKTKDKTVKVLNVLESFTGLSPVTTRPNYIETQMNGSSRLVTAKRTAAGTVASPADDFFPVDVAINATAGTDAAAPKDSDYQLALDRLKDYRDVSTIVLPGLNWSDDKTTYQRAITHAEFMQNRMVLVDPENPEKNADQLKTPADVRSAGFTTSPYTALYYPYLTVPNPFYDPETNAGVPETFAIAPSAMAAGMWARIDRTRGVWKAPAGLEATVRGALGPNVLIGNALQDNLNSSGVNCLRSIIGPTVIWGARTLATRAQPQYRYVPVRRTQNMIGESLYNALQAVVFEPNDHKLWGGLRASVGGFMDTLHRAGAFQGEKASDAYFVRCGLGSTMTQTDIDAGIVRVVVGFAPLKPAEFVVVEIQQIVGQTA